MLQKETLLMTRAEVSESDTVTTQRFWRRSQSSFTYVASENYSFPSWEKIPGKIGIFGMASSDFGVAPFLGLTSADATGVDEYVLIQAIRINNGPWIEKNTESSHNQHAELYAALWNVAGNNEPGDPVRVEVRL